MRVELPGAEMAIPAVKFIAENDFEWLAFTDVFQLPVNTLTHFRAVVPVWFDPKKRTVTLSRFDMLKDGAHV